MSKSRRAPSRRPGVNTPASTEFNPDYTHVKSDLARIGLLAGTFIALLVVLSFFLRFSTVHEQGSLKAENGMWVENQASASKHT